MLVMAASARLATPTTTGAVAIRATERMKRTERLGHSCGLNKSHEGSSGPPWRTSYLALPARMSVVLQE